MANSDHRLPEIADPPASFRSAVWQYFGYPVENKDGKRVTDKTHTICRKCFKKVTHATGNTTNMQAHLKRCHPDVNLSAVRKPTERAQQTTLPSALQVKLPVNSERAQRITRAIGIFLAKDMQPFSVVDDKGFRNLMQEVEPRYAVPTRPHFSQKVVPKLYKETKTRIEEQLKEADYIAITTDGWTSRATHSYLTITAHYITAIWQMANHVLQTRAVYESHTSEHLAEILTEAVAEWKITRAGISIPVTTDNARNIANAVESAGFSPHIRCFAHTVNLAAHKGMAVNQVSRLLGRVRKIVTFFHKSTTAAAVLSDKQKMLQLPSHKLVQDVTTRWNSSHDMLERYLEQQAAVFAALTDGSLKKKIKEVVTLSDTDVQLADDVVQVLKPLKTITILMSSEKMPTLSMILPLKDRILTSMKHTGSDSATVKEMKTAIASDFQDRYPQTDVALTDILHISTALDPRFKSLRFLDEATKTTVFHSLKEKIREQVSQTSQV